MEIEKPRVGIIGTGYVGLVSGACFADLGFQVTCLDVVEKKVEMINSAEPPIFENGLEELLARVVKEDNLLKATLDRAQTISNSDLIFICLPTPSAEDGSIDLSYIRNEVSEIGKILKNIQEYKVVVVKSTVVPGTTQNEVLRILEQTSGKKAGDDFGIAMNPEFLMEGLAISNFTNPDRVVIGAFDNQSYEMVSALYQSFDCPIIRTSLSGAEMIKYAANSFLATKISFINEIANICELVGIDVGEVAEGIGYDDRISPRFLRAGIGYGGSCFPKDVKALLSLSRQLGRSSNLLEATIQTNIQQPLRALDLLSNFIDVNGKTVGLLGLAFKPETDDMREAPSIIIGNKLLELGATVKGYDPIAKDTAEKALPRISHIDSVSGLIQDCDAVILVTEWKEFKTLGPKDFSSMRGNVIIDGRRILDWKSLINAGYQMKVIGQAIP